MAIEGLSEELAGNEALANFEDINGLAKSYLDTKSMVGNSIRIPSEEASQEDRDAFVTKLTGASDKIMLKPDFDSPEQSRDFYRTLGMPENAEGYKTPELQIPDGVTVDQAQIDGFKKMAHEAGMSNSQFQKIVGDFVGGQMAQAEADLAQDVTNQAALKDEWGMAYPEKMAGVNKILEQTGAPEEVIKAAKDGVLNPDIAKWADSLVEKIGVEGTDHLQGGQHKPGQITPEEARQRISEIYANPEHPFFKEDDVAHGDALTKMVQLQQMANPAASSDINDLRA